MTDPSTFAADWLSLREPIDHRSRASKLDRCLHDWLSIDRTASSEIAVLDLGSGAGSNLRYLSPRLPRPQHWTLLDHDRDLLARACSTEFAPNKSRVTARCLDLTHFTDIDLARPDLVTASAWLDLVSADWIRQFTERLERWHVPVLICLSVDGRRGFLDGSGGAVDDSDDAILREAFNRHQRQPKGLGDHPALGPDALEALADLLSEHFVVERRPSDWRLSADAPEGCSLAIELLEGWASAAQAVDSSLTPLAIESWRADRRRRIERGDLGLYVGHQDLLALPRC